MVKKNIGGSGLSAIDVGSIAVYKKLVYSQHKGEATFNFNIISDPVRITISGNAVFEEFKTREDLKKIEFICITGSCYTILSDLTTSEIYLRIKNFYDKVLNSDGNKIAILPSEPSANQMLDLVEQINSRGFLFYARREKDEYGVRLEQYATALKKKL